MSLYQGAIPTSAEDPYWGQYQFSDGAGHANSNYVACTLTSYQISTNWGPLGTQYAGLCGWINNYRVVSNVKQTLGTTYNITSTCQQEIQLDLIPVFQFAIFTTVCSNSPGAPLHRQWADPCEWQYLYRLHPAPHLQHLVTTTGSISSPVPGSAKAEAATYIPTRALSTAAIALTARP